MVHKELDVHFLGIARKECSCRARSLNLLPILRNRSRSWKALLKMGPFIFMKYTIF
jgi:hypothetical protein